jgi:uncharacterized protein YhhL (DUF1145 family)
MSQQINLLPPAPQQPILSATRALIVTAAWIVLVLLHSLQMSLQAKAAAQQAEQSARDLQQQQLLLQALRKKLGDSNFPGSIAEQIAALEPQTRVSRDLLARLESGELGSLAGYGAQLRELASLPAPGVWITQAAITNAGRTLRIEGRALKKEQLLPYARSLNAAMKPYGVELQHIDISPMRVLTDDAVPASPVFTFRLY